MVILYQLYSAENVLIAWDQGSGHFQPGWTNTITQKASLAHDISLFEMAHPMIFVSSPRTPHWKVSIGLCLVGFVSDTLKLLNALHLSFFKTRFQPRLAH